MEAVVPKVMNKVTKTFSKNPEKYVWMNSFLDLQLYFKWFKITLPKNYSYVFFKDFV